MSTTQTSKGEIASLTRAFIASLLKIENPHFRIILRKLGVLKGEEICDANLVKALEETLQQFFEDKEWEE